MKILNEHSIKKVLQRQEFWVLAFTIAMIAVFSILSKNFSSPDNIKLIFSQIAINGICAIGISMIIFLGGIDLSSGAILALCASCSGMAVNAGYPLIAVLVFSILIGAACGLLNGFLVAKLQIPPIITTLATMNVIRGVAIMVTGGDWITGFPKSFGAIGQGRFLGVPIPFIIFVFITIGVSVLVRHFNIGRKIYAVGENPEAAELAGFKIARVKLFAYIAAGTMIGLAGTVYASMIGTISASTTGSSLTFQVLAAALIGGLDINGGKGTTIGVCFGVLMLGVIKNGLILSRVSEYWIDGVTGAIIIIALVMNAFRILKKKRRLTA